MTLFSSIYKILRSPSTRKRENELRRVHASKTSRSPSSDTTGSPTPSPIASKESPILANTNASRIHVRISMHYCKVCCRRFPVSPDTTPPSSTCKHPVSTCSDCLDQWFSTLLTTNAPSNMICPDCTELLSYADMRKVVAIDIFAKYDRALLLDHLTKESFYWCAFKRCKSGQFHTPYYTTRCPRTRMKCAACGFDQCIKHAQAWHIGRTCEAYDTEKRLEVIDQERKSLGYLNKKAKRCPNPKCGILVQKQGGCDHMTCNKCQHQFCWRCLANYALIRDHGNNFHRLDCKWHPKQLDKKPDISIDAAFAAALAAGEAQDLRLIAAQFGFL
ncbi:hypothetical protein BT63DRAFT_187029 [Microthyrium microscopicum]|uniref:RBR-type E3 ubiquitin transferase n=1 Tax=Microthyrium microscopicum TaxID=703497 RepID=A0A6A6UKT6_9PEZI|nr:hypothetical protein BT63DRAFT_187029 [Microthyrium microscopicum]